MELANSMSKNRIPTPVIPKSQGFQLTEPKIPKSDRPVIGISFLQIDDKNYGLEHLAKEHNKQKGNRDVFNELSKFIKQSSKMGSIEEVINHFKPKHRIKNSDDKSVKMINKIGKEYNIETSDIIHLHTNGNGSGQFVLHGFRIYNVFEIVFIDPNHEMHR